MNVGKLSFARLVTYKLFKAVCIVITAHICIRKPVLLLANVRTLFFTSFLLLLFSYLFWFNCKQIFEEKGKFIFIFLQIP